MRLKDKVAIITGVGAGIGEATAELFVREGAKVVLNDLNEANGAATLAKCKAAGGDGIFVPGDVSLEETGIRIAEEGVKAFGRLDIVVNNAASFVQRSVEHATPADWQKVFGVNVFGSALVSKHAIPHIRKQGRGSIVNVASISSFIAQAGFATYNASKGAVIQMTKCMALDLAADNIRANSVCPGCIDTSATRREAASLNMPFEKWCENAAPKHMLNRVGEAIEVANAILFLASDESSFITATALMVDGGYIEW